MLEFFSKNWNLYGEKWAIKMIKTQVCKALHDYKKGDEYGRHLVIAYKLIADYAQAKGISLS